MIVWGGEAGANYLNDGGRYIPSADNWASMNNTGAPAARIRHTVVWMGSEMLVFGGASSSAALGDTSGYTPGHFLYLYQRP